MRETWLLKCPDCKARWVEEVAPGFFGSFLCPRCGLWEGVRAFHPRIVPSYWRGLDMATLAHLASRARTGTIKPRGRA